MLTIRITNDTAISAKLTFPSATLANIALYELIGRNERTFIRIPSTLLSWDNPIKYTIIITNCTLPALLLISSVLDTSAPIAPYMNT